MSEQHSHLPPEYGPHPQFPKSVKPGIPKLPLPKVKWQTVKIGDLFKVINVPVKMEDDQQYDLVTVKRARGGVVDRETLYGRDISVKSQFYVHEGNFLISKRQIVHGACGFVPKKLEGAIVSNEYSVLACTDLILPAFLNYLSYTPYFQQTCFHSSIGVHVEKMIFKLDEWFRWKINIPSLPEQQKIADFLSSVDAKLAKLSRKKELLEDYKRGLMQQIFSQKLRFKQDDGSEFPEWEIGIFSDFVNKVSDLFNDGNKSGSLPSVELESIEAGSGKLLEIFDSKDQRSTKNRFAKGDVLFGKLRPYLNKFAQPNFDGVCSSEIWVLRGSKVSNDYLLFLTQSKGFQEAVNIQSGSKMPRADWKIVSESQCSIPCCREQQKIADFLSSFDQKINVVSKQIEQLETFKKGLLQKLFV